MQPTYLPWAGYFNLIASVDMFVFLDDAQYERGTWHNRNRVLLSTEPHWITVPVVRGRLGDAINQVGVDEKLPWRRKHMALLRQVYGRHPFGEEVLGLCEASISNRDLSILSRLNEDIVRAFCGKLGIATRILRSSELGIQGTRSERLARMCEHLACDEYLSPLGAEPYLVEDRFVDLTPVRLTINNYQPRAYTQRGRAGFTSHLSIVDVVANLGWAESAAYVRGESMAAPEENSHR